MEQTNLTLDNMEKLSVVLKNQAITLGLCTGWTEQWGNPDMQGLINKYLHGLDFCIKHDWPSVDFIKKHFDKSLLHENNIYVDEEVHSRNISHIAVLNGGCSGMLLFDGLSSCDIYLRHSTDVVIDCSRLSKIFINIYDKAKVKVIQRDAASVYVYQHGDDCVIATEGDVMIRKKV